MVCKKQLKYAAPQGKRLANGARLPSSQPGHASSDTLSTSRFDVDPRSSLTKKIIVSKAEHDHAFGLEPINSAFIKLSLYASEAHCRRDFKQTWGLGLARHIHNSTSGNMKYSTDPLPHILQFLSLIILPCLNGQFV